MEHDAIKLLQKSAVYDAVAITLLQRAQDSTVPLVVVPDDMTIQSLESYMPTASRYRVKFQTDNLLDFIEYTSTMAS